MQIVGPIQIWRGCLIYLKTKQKNKKNYTLRYFCLFIPLLYVLSFLINYFSLSFLYSSLLYFTCSSIIVHGAMFTVLHCTSLYNTAMHCKTCPSHCLAPKWGQTGATAGCTAYGTAMQKIDKSILNTLYYSLLHCTAMQCDALLGAYHLYRHIGEC